jgi:FAD/FMN-containing dehydrogenase/DNA-binding HxlR family transcriptional regulator
MHTYGQFCPIARGSEVLAERWTPIILRNLLLGCSTFNEIAAGAPGLSRALLTRRLHQLERAGVITISPKPDGHGSLYEPTRAGRELWPVLAAIAQWAEQWTDVTPEHSDPEAVLWSWSQAYLRRDLLPERRVVVRFDFERRGRPARLWLHVEARDAEICRFDPRFGDDLVVVVNDHVAFARWHLGLVDWAAVLRAGGVEVTGPTELRRALPTWNASTHRHERHRAQARRAPGGREELPLEAPEAGHWLAVPPLSGPPRPDATAIIPGFAGRLVTPDDPDYDRARAVWNGAVDRRPRLIACCVTDADVVAALRFGRYRDLDIRVRAGGHGVAGTAVCDDGLVIDLGAMKRIEVDPVRATATVGAGAVWGELDGATSALGLATTGGIVSHTGVAGLTLGGGMGWLMRRHGVAADNLVAARLVTVDGEVLDVDEDRHPEVLWGLRGGGGGLGVVTSFRYRLHPLPSEVLAGHVVWPLEDAAEVLRAYRDFVAKAPREVATMVTLRRVPPDPHLPVELHGRPVCLVGMLALAEPASAERLLAPMRRQGRPLLDLVRYRPYPNLQSMVDATVPHGWHYYWKATGLPSLRDGAIDAMVDASFRAASSWSFAVLFHLGGRVADAEPDATAYSRRHVAHELVVNAAWLPDDPIDGAEAAWARDYVAAVRPTDDPGAYVNFLDHDDTARTPTSYSPAAHERLVRLRARLDPTGVLRPAAPTPTVEVR